MAMDATLVGLALERSGTGCLLLDASLVVQATGPGAKTLLDRDDASLTGQSFASLFPELEPYLDRLAPLTEDPGYVARFRIQREEHHFLKVTVQQAAETGQLLLLLEDVSVDVMRGDTLSRHIRELESRCRSLEKALIEKSALDPDSSRYEPETGLLRSAAVLERLVQEEAFCRRWRCPLSIVVLNFPDEHLKDINRKSMDGLRGLLRAGDAVGRTEENLVMIVLPQTDDSAVAVIRARIQRHFAESGVPGIGSAQLADERNDSARTVYERARADAAPDH